MYKVLIVDDEYYFRQALRITLPWEELGFRIAGEAKNGEEALALLTEIEPDIVLVDINMPKMDGMDFIQNAIRNELDTKFIVLTGHSEFSYAKQAVQLGVFKYVLKPIDEVELQDALLELKRLIQKERSARLELNKLKSQAQEDMPFLKERLLNDWLQGYNVKHPAYSSERLQHLGIQLNASNYLVVAIDIESIRRMDSEEEKLSCKSIVQQLAREKMTTGFQLITCFDTNDRFVMIIGFLAGFNDEVERLCEAIRQAIQTELACTVTIGVGNEHRGFESVSESYKEAIYALKHRFIMGDNKVILHSMISESGMTASLFSLARRSHLLKCLRGGNLHETEAWIEGFFQEAIAKKASMEMFYISGLEIVSTCMEFLDEMSQSFDRIFQDTARLDFYTQFQNMDSYSQLESWIRGFIMKVMAYAHDKKHTKAIKVAEQVKSYIQEHYGEEELRIEDIAKNVHMSYTHLCYLFKRETSVTINDYLTELRIAKAKELFDEGIQVVQYVASQVGYADANYFGKCFKKYIGVSPSQYIKNIE